MNQPEVLLDAPAMARCRRFAEGMVARYAADPRRCALSQGGAERDVDRQMIGRVAEVAVALHAGLDPAVALDWGTEPVAGADLVLPGGTRLEIKASALRNRIAWPPNKRHLYHDKPFDVLVSVSVEGARCIIDGWIAKGRFLQCMQVADGGLIGPGLWEGTMFMVKSDPNLRAIDDLLWIDAHYRRAA